MNQKIEDELSQVSSCILSYSFFFEYITNQSSKIAYQESIFSNLNAIIFKALTPDESAPKQKHVRACIVYTWDIKSSGSFWSVLKNQPILGEDIMSFKALITFHKVIKDGHPSVLKDALSERAWLESLGKGTLIMGNKGSLYSIENQN